MPGFKLFGRKKRRKYPVKLDPEGRSARSRCFELFAQKAPNQEIAKMVDLPIDTVRRYHLQWNDDPNLERKYIYAKSLFHKTNPDRDKNLEMFACAWGYSKEQLESILSQSHGLRRLMARKILSPAHLEADHKRHFAFELALLISDHLTKHGGKYEDVYYSFRRWMQENMKYREDEDANIKEWNQKMELFHGVLASAAKQEHEGRVKPDVFSEEERKVIIQLELKSRFKQLQTIYWQKIAGLMVGGQTEEQSREKLYQDLLATDPRAANLMREFQDKVHPLKKDGPPAPPQPPRPP
jgi:hypothetical protein